MQKMTVKDFPKLDFGDVRRSERFVSIVNNLSTQPGSSIPRQNQGWYDTKATYAFFKNEEVSLAALKETLMHFGAGQVAGHLQVLVVHDISHISYNDLKAEGLGYLANKEGRGILCYSSLALTTAGLPLALLYQHTWVRPLHELGKSAKRKQTGFEDKESYRWYEGMQQVNELLGAPVHKIHIADREADIYELFFHCFEETTDLLIRARHNRQVEESGGGQLWDFIAEQPAQATVKLVLPERQGKKKRTVKADVRYHTVELLRPAATKKGYASVVVSAIEVKETGGGKPGEERIHWKLLTTLEITGVASALQCVQWYTFRWLIERFHYVLKSGTRIEGLQLKAAESLQKAVHVYSLAAFRIMQLVYASRHHPEASCEVALTKAQWRTLYLLIHSNKQVPPKPPSLQQAVRWIGRLGGHLGRRADGPPGLKTVWQGYAQLCQATTLYEQLTE